ncbi:MAG: hypothetical protein C0483_11625 [Pirellula sp.]|nr:hypothetical protein [Pirellula sp.]
MAVHEPVAADAAAEIAAFTPPHPGSPLMPPWNKGELPLPPVFTWRKIAMFVGPGLVAGASAIGAGEWLNGPMVCARYGGALLWLATLSILAQIVYNLEVSRYTLYTGESIFTGKFRTLPGPLFWVAVYLVLDFGTIFPYLAASAGTPIACLYLGKMPDPVEHKSLLEYISFGVFLLAIVPLIFGGKVYNSIRVLMTFKIFAVLGFLAVLAFFYSKPATWAEIGSGFLKFGTVPVMKGEDANGNGVLDPGEDWDNDGRLDGVEQRIDKNKNGDPHEYGEFQDEDGDGRYDGYKVENIFVTLWEGKPLPHVDLSMIAILGAMAALAGNGGLTNTNVSGYTRDQGWGMGKHVGAIPSVIGGHSVKLSHVGMVFPVTPERRKRFAGWYRHVFRDQFFLFGIASFIGLAMPSMLSVQFLPRGTEVNPWLAAGMTADGVHNAIGPTMMKGVGWFMTLFCGFLVLALSTTTTADGYFRRWIDVLWTGLPALKSWKPHNVGKLYFGMLCCYCVSGLLILKFVPQGLIMPWATNIYNYALGFSCLHVFYVNSVLLPKELRPNWFIRAALIAAFVFFTTIAVITTMTLVRFGK